MNCELQCYRKGCGKTYIQIENIADSCRYHPGDPVFHDALKGWSCCGRKSTDFTVFLEMPGCAYDFHSNEKPPPAPKIETQLLSDELVIKGPPPSLPREKRPDPNEPKLALKSIVGATLKQALEKRMANLSVNTTSAGSETSDQEVKVGTACKNNSCTSHYSGPESNKEDCVYHPGMPIFHEGMKYWSCCQKKTADFDKFMEQVGCSNGEHKWVKANDAATKNNCRMDWHQTGGTVIISVFSKCADPTKTIVKANQVSIDIYIVYEDDKVFADTFELDGLIKVESSGVKLLGAKVEITLKKATASSWAQLKYVQKSPASGDDPK